ncbi:MAG: MBL fold metallo-hydrolase, partial [Anaerolineaceae bacterium]|nr:MBL fold metallo-hydrolase [Anaerolineaceae bacterium]
MEFNGLLKITYLGQAGALIDWSGGRFLIDPYLSNYV